MPEHHHPHHHHHHHERDGYAYHAGEPGPGPNFHRLRRDMRNKQWLGVCAGIADYFGWDTTVVRIATVALTVLFFPMPLIAYVIAGMVMKPAQSEPPPRSTEDERFWRTFSVKPKATFQELKHRFRAIDARVSDMERAVTSEEYGLNKAFRDLESGARN